MDLLIGLIVAAGMFWLAISEHLRFERQKHERRIARDSVMKLHDEGVISSAEAIETLAEFDDNTMAASEGERRWEEKKELMKKKSEERRIKIIGERL